MKLYLVTNGKIAEGQVFTDLGVALYAASQKLPGETLRMYQASVDFVAKDQNGITCDCAGDVRKTLAWLRRD